MLFVVGSSSLSVFFEFRVFVGFLLLFIACVPVTVVLSLFQRDLAVVVVVVVGGGVAAVLLLLFATVGNASRQHNRLTRRPPEVMECEPWRRKKEEKKKECETK